MSLLYQATLFLLAAVIAVPLFRRLGAGAVLGYLAAGVVIGPSVLGLVSDVEAILEFAKIGVVLLLFLVGLELAPRRLWVMRHNILGLGMAGVLAPAVAFGVVAWLLFDLDWQAALLIGFGLGFSSTAFAMQTLAERNEIASAHGRSAFAMLLFKYLALLPLLAAIPLLGGEAEMAPDDVLVAAVRTTVILLAIIVGGHFLLRPVFRLVARFGARETFTATALLVVLGTSAIVAEAGLPMALGAFLAGVLLADSEYRHEVQVSIEPFKGLLLGLFFIAVGMTVDLHLIVELPVLVPGITAAVLALKAAILYTVARLGGLEPSSGRALAVVMPQGGELAFVMFSTAATYGVMAERSVDVLIAVVALTMAATPLLVLLNDRVLAPRLDPDEGATRPYDTVDEDQPGVIICGFGRFGQMVARVLHSAHIPFTALDANPRQVDFIRGYGHQIYYGDPARVDLLEAAGAAAARAIVVTVNDIDDSMRTVEHIRKHFPAVPVYARARNRQHALRLMDLGCQAIVRETLAPSLELGGQLLTTLGWEPERAQELVANFREHDEVELHKQHALYQEQNQFAEASQDIDDELEGLFAADEADDIEPEPGSSPT